jgi:epoxyqueuosine reductase QueG
MVPMTVGDLKREITLYLQDRGADLVGFARPDRWHEDGRVPGPYRPDALWPMTRTVVVIGIQMPLPVVETTPSVQHRDLYNTCNRALDDLAFSLARWLNRHGHAAIPLSRDGYANIHVLIRKPAAAFAHGFAAHYSGIGHKGINNTILTKAFGPRIRFVSVFTAARLPADPLPSENHCIRCGACVRLCPVQALRITKKELAERKVVVADYNARACAEWARALTEKGCYPCGICVKVCPAGADRILYGRDKGLNHYRREAGAPADTDDPDYRAWAHIRAHGSLIAEEDALSLAGLRPVAERIMKENKTS